MSGGQASHTNGVATGVQYANGSSTTPHSGRSSFHAPGHPTGSLREALREAGRTGEPDSPGNTSEEDYDKMTSSPSAVVVRRKSRPVPVSVPFRSSDESRGEEQKTLLVPGEVNSSSSSAESLPLNLRMDRATRATIIAADDKALREVVRNGLQRTLRGSDGNGDDPAGVAGGAARPQRRGKFSDLVFTRQFSAFDRQNEFAAKSPFHGFFTLFWIGVFLFVVKIGAENWKRHGNPLGENQIMAVMFRRDVLVLLVSDGVMCALTGVSWLLQRAVFAGYIDWDRSGWIIQSIWQTLYIICVVQWTLIRDWPWTHTVFFVLHGLVMLMKQHSYSFYNGYLSSAYKKRRHFLSKLKQLENRAPCDTPSKTEPLASAVSTSHLLFAPTAQELKERRMSRSQEKAGAGIDMIAKAIESGDPLDEDQVQVFERIIKWEVDALTDELKGKATRAECAYPNSLTFLNHYEFNMLPTLVYELEYPRSESINWYYAAEKMVACFGVIFVMILVSQSFIYPVVMETVRMKEIGMPLAERFQAVPWMLFDLIFPFMMEYLLAWYLIWETILNFIAELTFFADRSFYDAWWNSVSWDQFARDWNRPVHNFLLRHVYHSSISAMKVNKHTATLITFFLSACFHELLMWCIFKKLRGYLLALQMFQLPLVQLSRTKWLRNKETLGNMIFWLGIFTGPSVLCSLYLIL